MSNSSSQQNKVSVESTNDNRCSKVIATVTTCLNGNCLSCPGYYVTAGLVDSYVVTCIHKCHHNNNVKPPLRGATQTQQRYRRVEDRI
ncbi:MAG: hypothetical protein M3044_00745 [Thermoproteota archaeon]|nr:hypothetical protein [Thermoproteota archaeon]